MYYRSCPLCNASLDPGEKCDCQEQREKQKEKQEKQFRKDPKTGQLMMIWGRKEHENVL